MPTKDSFENLKKRPGTGFLHFTIIYIEAKVSIQPTD